MTDMQITQEILRYIEDTSYGYAVMIDGEWGCGKTFYIKDSLIRDITSHEAVKEKVRKVKYISLYGCKSVHEIQENLVWSVAEDAVCKIKKNEKTENKPSDSTITKNMLLSSRKIGNAVIKKILPNEDPYSFISDWLLMNNYIFVFDDLERCDCPINELFGFINGLVEHELTKVILVANEKEISQGVTNNNEALEYLIALEDKIEWPKPEEKRSFYNSQRNPDTLNVQELEYRRRWLFPTKDMAENYKRIREKIIGVTLRYEPDIEHIIDMMIQNTIIAENHIKIIKNRTKNMMTIMDNYGHHNLRTFQFFLSKVSYLLEKTSECTISEEYDTNIKTCIVDECFRDALKYKAHIKPKKWEQEINSTKDNSRFKSILNYIEKGEFSLEEYQSDVDIYTEELKQNLMPDDPFNLLYNQYYYHNQAWCEDKMELIIDRLKTDKYPRHIYIKIIIIMVRLTILGFNKKYLMNTQDAIIKNIQNSQNKKKLNNDLFFIDDDNLKMQTKKIIDEINQVIEDSSAIAKRKNINDILQSNNWVDELYDYLKSTNDNRLENVTVFYQASSDDWYNAIHNANPEQIDQFRYIISELYPRNSKRENVEKDILVIKEILDKLKPENEEDLIKRAITGWLKSQLTEIVKMYLPEE